MKRELLEQELFKVLNEVAKLEIKAELESDTAAFLKKETDKLLKKSKKKNISVETRDVILKEMESLKRRLSIEVKLVEDDLPKLKQLENKLKELTNIFTSGQVED